MHPQIFGVLLLALAPAQVFCIFNRRTWGARTASSPLARFDGPASLVVIHTTNTNPCSIPSMCKSVVRDLQIKNIASNSSDIAYNFLIGCCSGVYEGTGWDYKAPISHNYKDPAIHVALIGKFDESAVPTHMSQSLRALISESQLRNKLKNSFTITEHKSNSSTRKLMVKNFLQGFAEYKEQVNDLLLPEQRAATSTTAKPAVSVPSSKPSSPTTFSTASDRKATFATSTSKPTTAKNQFFYT
ncbi:Hypothetical predicted protein [Cloeon dipterum]|uniref:Peptidoglycan recognition protein family domain-containing protein n=1 Tax=Cloeon dipterum TaxID=197152 RepID=A0A8S1DLT6_9INSE|nr:Hypothetical predicted protein [Cloeon dipterum]